MTPSTVAQAVANERTQFDYLLNAFERASQAEQPVLHDYAGKRRALFAYVRDLESRPPSPLLAAAVAAAEALEKLMNLRWPSESATTDDGCYTSDLIEKEARTALAALRAAIGKETK